MKNFSKYLLKQLIVFLLFGVIIVIPLLIISKYLSNVWWGFIVWVILFMVLVRIVLSPLTDRIMKDVSYENLTTNQKKFLIYCDFGFIIILGVFAIFSNMSLYMRIIVPIALLFLLYTRTFKKWKELKND